MVSQPCAELEERQVERLRKDLTQMKIVLEKTSLPIEGKDAHDIILQLKLSDWTRHASRDDYKKNMVRRVSIFHGELITYTTDEEFLQELNRIGFIKEIING